MIKEEKSKREKSFNNLNSIEACLRYCRMSGSKYNVTVSNYMTEISGVQNIKFVREDKSKKCFSAFAKIKTDIKKSNIWVDVEKDNIHYYDTGDLNTTCTEAYNIDLKSAYATILYNSRLISKATYKYVCSMDKQDRLASIGMLASHRYIFTYQGSKIIGMKEICSDTENYFYFACEKTFQIMQEIKAICGDCFLFSWVDSVYYTDNSKTAEIKAYLTSIKHLYTYEKIHELSIQGHKKYHRISFKKASKESDDLTVFNIPRASGVFVQCMINKYTKSKRSFSGSQEHRLRGDGTGNLRFFDYIKESKKLKADQKKFTINNSNK